MTQAEHPSQPQSLPEFSVSVAEDGTLTLSPELLERLDLKSGGTLRGKFEEGRLVLMTSLGRARLAQRRIREDMKQNGLEWPTETGAECIRKMRSEDAAIEEEAWPLTSHQISVP